MGITTCSPLTRLKPGFLRRSSRRSETGASTLAGAGDNKGQFFAHIAALRAWHETTGGFPVGVKFLAEGEEECGSPHIEAFVKANTGLLDCDLVYTSDGPMLDDDAPTIEYGVRGMVYVELRAKGASHDLHSGNWGGLVPNPAWTLTHLLATMFSPEGKILIDGFHDDIVPVSPAGKVAMYRLKLDQQASLASVGVQKLPAPEGVSYFSRTMERPTCNIAGFTSGYGGVGSKTIIPAEAVVNMDFRWCPIRIQTTSCTRLKRTPWLRMRPVLRSSRWGACVHRARR